MWATILALIWLHGVKVDAKEEWSLLAQKALSWLQAANGMALITLIFKSFFFSFCSGLILYSFYIAAPYLTKCVDTGNSLLGCKVPKEDLGL